MDLNVKENDGELLEKTATLHGSFGRLTKHVMCAQSHSGVIVVTVLPLSRSYSAFGTLALRKNRAT
jgi:hypothetical protein